MCTVSRALTSNSIGHGNRDHETSSNRGRLEHSTTKLSKPDLDRLLIKALQAPSVGGSCVIPITLPYWEGIRAFSKDALGQIVTQFHEKEKMLEKHIFLQIIFYYSTSRLTSDKKVL